MIEVHLWEHGLSTSLTSLLQDLKWLRMVHGSVGLEVIGFVGVVAPSGAPKQSVVESDYLIQIGAFRSKEGANRFGAKQHECQ